MGRNFDREVERGLKVFKRRKIHVNGKHRSAFAVSKAAQYVVDNYRLKDYLEMLELGVQRGLIKESDVIYEDLGVYTLVTRAIEERLKENPFIEKEEKARIAKYGL